MIQIIVSNTHSQIKNLEDLSIIDKISSALSYSVESAKYTWQYRTGRWDGTHKLLTKGLKFPTGCLELVCSILDSYSIDYTLNDKRSWQNKKAGGLKWHGFDLYDYQNEIVDIAMDKKCGMIKAATGAGKSIILSRIVYEYNVPTVIYVVSLDLLEQMHTTLEKCLGVPVGMVGGGKCSIEKITVCSAWTAGKAYSKGKQEKESLDEDVKPDKWTPNSQQKQSIKQMIEGAELVILDESQFAAASSIQAILKNSKSAAHRYGLSGTPWRSDGCDLLLEAAFGSNICDLKASKLIREGYLVQPKIAFRDIPKYGGKIKKNWSEVESKYILENEIRNEILIKNLKKLLDLGRRPLILFRKHKHGRLLEELLPTDINYSYITGDTSLEDRIEIRDDFGSGKTDLLLASSVYDQGVDLPALDALILAGGGKSTAKALQRIGRVIRANKDGGKKDAYVVETFDQESYVKSHSIIRHGVYKTEPEFKIKIGENMQKHLKKYSS